MSEIMSNLFGRTTSDPTQNTPNPSLYERIGGQDIVDQAVDIFLRKSFSDARINYFFFGVNIAEQSVKQKAFLAMAFGGPHHYTGRDMRKSHARLIGMGMKDRHFDIVMDHLHDTLVELNIESSIIKEVLDLTETTRDDVMNRRTKNNESSHAHATSSKSADPVRLSSKEVNIDEMGSIKHILPTNTALIKSTSTIREILPIFSREGVNSLPVTDDKGVLLGVISVNDVVRFLNERQ
jgi:hemoglobin